jgi:hypothetical protein
MSRPVVRITVSMGNGICWRILIKKNGRIAATKENQTTGRNLRYKKKNVAEAIREVRSFPKEHLESILRCNPEIAGYLLSG